MHPLVRPLLQREELVGAEVALVVARALARQDRRESRRRSERSPDPHLQPGERNAAILGHEPRVLHIEAFSAIGRDRVRVHREDHVRGELGLDALADLRVLDHRHPDRVAGHVAEVVAALGEAGRDRAVDVVRRRAARSAVCATS